MLPLVQDAHHAGKTDGANYAFLLDDIRVAEGKPQVYGTRSKQGSGPYPIEDEANVDKRRAEVGLEPLADQLEKQERNNAPQTTAGPESCLKETTLKVANRDLIITLKDAERIKLTLEKYLAKTRPKPKPVILRPDEVFIDCGGTVRMGAWILESSVFSSEPELRLTVRTHNSEYLIVRREIRVQQTEGQWKVVGDGQVTYHRERK